MSVIEERLIFLDTNLKTRDEVFRFAAKSLQNAGRLKDVETAVKGFYEREDMFSTYMDNSVAIPHCKSDTITLASVAVIRNSFPVEWSSQDENAELFFLLVIPQEGNKEHLRILAQLAQALLDEELVTGIKTAKTAAEIFKLLEPINFINA